MDHLSGRTVILRLSAYPPDFPVSHICLSDPSYYCFTPSLLCTRSPWGELQYWPTIFTRFCCTKFWLQVFCAPSNWMPVQYWYNVGLQYSQIRRYMKYSSLNMSLDEFFSKFVNMSSSANLPVWQVNYIGWSSYIMSTLLLSLIWNGLD